MRDRGASAAGQAMLTSTVLDSIVQKYKNTDTNCGGTEAGNRRKKEDEGRAREKEKKKVSPGLIN